MENFKNLVLHQVELLNTIAKIAEDSKFDWFTETWLFIPHIRSIAKDISSIKDVHQELKEGLTVEQRNDIFVSVVSKLDLQSDEKEQLAEDILSWLISTVLLIFKLIEQRKNG
jgi:hypothetical protein